MLRIPGTFGAKGSVCDPPIRIDVGTLELSAFGAGDALRLRSPKTYSKFLLYLFCFPLHLI